MFLLLLIAACTLLFFYIKWNSTYWKREGFPYVEPKIPFGVLDSVRRRERSFGMAIYDVYKESQEKVLGIFLLFRPAILIRDAQLARDILTKDFSSFHDRGIYIDEDNDPLSGSLLALRGQKWKSMRTKLAPSFTSGKLKAMFGTVLDISNKMVNHLNGIVPDEGSIEVEGKKLIETYAIDIIASSIFGLEVNSFENPNNEFCTISEKVNEPTFTSNLRGTCQFLYPSLEKLFIRIGWREEAPTSMMNIVRKTIEFREANNVSRKDMLQLLIQLRNTGKINEDDDVWSVETKAEGIKSLSMEMIAAQLFLFYIAGYETTAAAVSFTLFEFSQYPDLLEKAQNEVEEVFDKHGKLSYDSIQDMHFLDLCLAETIRKYPGLPILNRECTQDFVVHDTGKVIKKGTPIIISLIGIHRDEEYFPDPMRYEPERFLKENMKYNPAAYMPFGEGPRHCIAQRMGKVNAKVALAQILKNFKIEYNNERREIEIETYGVPILPKGGIPLRLSKKKSAQ